jgi:hypothetical protein
MVLIAQETIQAIQLEQLLRLQEIILIHQATTHQTALVQTTIHRVIHLLQDQVQVLVAEVLDLVVVAEVLVQVAEVDDKI